MTTLFVEAPYCAMCVAVLPRQDVRNAVTMVSGTLYCGEHALAAMKDEYHLTMARLAKVNGYG